MLGYFWGINVIVVCWTVYSLFGTCSTIAWLLQIRLHISFKFLYQFNVRCMWVTRMLSEAAQ